MVGVLSHTEDEIRKTAEEIERAGGKAIPLAADVADDGQMRKAVADLVQAYGRLDIVFANAGINGVWAPIDELKPEVNLDKSRLFERAKTLQTKSAEFGVLGSVVEIHPGPALVFAYVSDGSDFAALPA